MPLPATLLILATLLPLVSFTVLMFIGKRMGNPLAGWVATAAIFGSLVCSIVATITWVNGGTADGVHWGYATASEPAMPINLTLKWMPVGEGLGQDHPGFVDLGVYVDSLTIVMFSMITGVATLVHLFSIGYMSEDKRFPRFFTYLGLFCFSMLGLVIGGTIMQLFVFWELVGLCSYLLIGFWYEKKSASNAAIKAFVTNRVGDFGFLIGLGILFYHVGNVTLAKLAPMLGAAGAGGDILLPNGTVFSATMLTVMGIGLFFGAVGKSAQFPLHVWLPDAMEGPTPVSALIHAATMVAAGVYLVGRIFPILTPDAKLFIAIIGATTLTMAALIACAQTDIKKVLAYSTLSQLGYMILALGIGSWVGGLFHLITHAFFKALLFLGSGSVIHAAHHEQELPQYGGLWRKIPITAITFGIAVLAIAGTPYFSGFYSKDMILAHAGAFSLYATQYGPDEHSSWFKLLFYLPTCIAYVTAFYMTRCWMLTFWGKPRNQHLYDHAHETPILWIPLAVLAVLSVIGGNMLGVKEMLDSSIAESRNYAARVIAAEPDVYGQRTFTGFDTAWPSHDPHAVAHVEEGAVAHAAASASETAYTEGWDWMHHSVGYAFLIGIGAGVLIYFNGYKVVDAIMRIPLLGGILRILQSWLKRRMLFDELYSYIFVGAVMALSRMSALFDMKFVDGMVNGAASMVRRMSDFAGLTDKYVVDGAVNGAATLTQRLGSAVRAPQTGRIRMYVTVLMLSFAILLAIAIIVVVSL